MVLSAYCKQRIIQLYFDRKLSYGGVVKALEEEQLKATKRTVWMIVKRYKNHRTIFRLPRSIVDVPYKNLIHLETESKQV